MAVPIELVQSIGPTNLVKVIPGKLWLKEQMSFQLLNNVQLSFVY
jgi:hypothetical protein